MATRVAINGFGRIGRNLFRAAVQRGVDELEFVAINDLTDTKTLAHLLKYDSVHGTFDANVHPEGDELVVGDRRLKVLSERDPAKLPWGDLDIDIALECTGRFRTREDAGLHLKAGAKRVLISAPAKSEIDLTLVYGVNHEWFKPEHQILSNASCTTNCLAPMVKVLADAFGYERGLMSTVHSYTNSQQILDLPHKDLRRARAAAVSMIPTSTGAAIATTMVLPDIKDRLDGMAVRVPTPCVSLTDLVAVLKREVTAEEVNDAFRKASEGPMKDVLGYSEVPLVSIDYTNNPNSCTIDADFTVSQGTLVKVIGWYDNEWGFSNRMVDVARYVGNKG